MQSDIFRAKSAMANCLKTLTAAPTRCLLLGSSLAKSSRWLHTGDLGYMDENGVLFVTGRIKRIFMTRGRDRQITKVFPDRIEAELLKHPAVELCCVIAVPDETRINYPMAYLVANRKSARMEQLKDELLRLCHENLPAYMIPERIEMVDDLPRTERGKVDYRALEEMAKKSN